MGRIKLPNFGKLLLVAIVAWPIYDWYTTTGFPPPNWTVKDFVYFGMVAMGGFLLFLGSIGN